MGFPQIPETQSSGGGFNPMNVDDLLEIIKRRVAGRRVGKYRYDGVTEPRNRRHENDAVYHRAFDVFHQTIRNDGESHHAEPERGALHSVVQAENLIGNGAVTEQTDRSIWGSYDCR